MDRRLVRWNEAYKKKGLRIIEIDDGAIDTLGAVRDHAYSLKTKHAVVWDDGGRLTRKYQVSSFPTALLVDASGTIVWIGAPTLDLRAAERRIQRELARLPKLLQQRTKLPPRDPNAKEPRWRKSAEAFKDAAVDGRWVMLFKYWPANPESKRLQSATFPSRKVLALIHENFHSVISDHPRSRTKREPKLWKKSDAWDPKVYIWLISPDKKQHRPLDHKKDGRVIDSRELQKRLEAFLKEHDVKK
ncbi:MAG: hypothetical protein V3T86_04065 [Planctomycetota bacterium]